jgi:peptide/nickel transport system permease protein
MSVVADAGAGVIGGAGVAAPPPAVVARRRRPGLLLGLGLVLLLGPLVASLVARPFFSHNQLNIFAYAPSLAPSWAHPLGTDGQGRDLLASVVYGMAPTYEVAFLAGILGLVAGTALGVVSGYLGGLVDTAIRSVTDVLLAIPPFAMLVVIAALFGTHSVPWMAVIIALVSWALPARAIRSQVLSLREQGFVTMNRLTNRGSFAIMFGEIVPNMLPYVMSTFVGLTSGALLTAIGLELLGLGPVGTTDLGTILQSAISFGAVSQGLWWWWGPPAVVLVVLFIGLFLVSLTFDEISNPRLARRHG